MDPINNVFSNDLETFVSTYLDEFLLYKKSFEEHLQHLDMEVKKIGAEKLYEMLSECSFAVKKVEYFEHLISNKSVFVE